MSSIQYYREFISERLSAAAEEIFCEFEKTITQYEEVLNRQRRLLQQIGWKAKPDVHPAGFSHQRLCNQQKKQSLDQPGTNLSLILKKPEDMHHHKEPEPPQVPEDANSLRIKQEQEELWTSQDELVLSPETDTFEIEYESSCEETFMRRNVDQQEDEGQHRLVDFSRKPSVQLHRLDGLQPPVCMEERSYGQDQDEPQPPQIRVDRGGTEPPQSKEEQEKVCSSQDKDELVLKQEPECFLVTPVHEESFPSGPNIEQSFSHCSPISESPGQEDNEPVDSESAATKTNSVNNSSPLDGVCKTNMGKISKRCGICRKLFKKKNAIRNHLKSRMQEKLFSCEICGTKVCNSSALKKHHTIHTEGRRPCTCTTCGKSFLCLASLQRHEQNHTAKREFVCHICGKILHQRHVFGYHMKWHTDKKPHSYNIRSWKPCTPISTPTEQKTN